LHILPYESCQYDNDDGNMTVYVQLMESLCRLMKECWHAKPSARLTMLRVKKSLGKLSKDVAIAMSYEKL